MNKAGSALCIASALAFALPAAAQSSMAGMGDMKGMSGMGNMGPMTPAPSTR